MMMCCVVLCRVVCYVVLCCVLCCVVLWYGGENYLNRTPLDEVVHQPECVRNGVAACEQPMVFKYHRFAITQILH